MSPPLVSCDLYSRFISYSQIYDYYLFSPHSNLRYPQISTQVNASILIYRSKGIYIQRHLSENSLSSLTIPAYSWNNQDPEILK